jgi:hypothetical protein
LVCVIEWARGYAGVPGIVFAAGRLQLERIGSKTGSIGTNGGSLPAGGENALRKPSLARIVKAAIITGLLERLGARPDETIDVDYVEL